MIDYRWSCQICEKGNAPSDENCIHCGFPSTATGEQIEQAKSKVEANNGFEPKEPINSLVLISGFSMMLVGGILLKFAIMSTVTAAFWGFGFLMIGAWVVDKSGYRQKKKK